MAKGTAARKSVERYRQRLRRAGLRPIQLWVPDTRARGFGAECRRQSRLAARDKAGENDVLDWIEQSSDAEGWNP
jgi:hypothetical protein